MPDHNGAMTMGEIGDAWAKDRQRIAELEADKASLKEKLKLYIGGWPSLEKRIQELEAQVKVADGLKDEYSLLLVRNKVLKEKLEKQE